MDIRAMLNAMSDSLRGEREKYHLTLGGLIDALEATDGALLVALEDGAGIAEPHSYRGYYEDLAFERMATPGTVAALLAECKYALGQTFEGYKGGDFAMTERTPLWVSSYGSASGVGIVGVSEVGGQILLQTKLIDA